ncbi:hypothetical protein AB205_0052120, partial [Aquarana catesbeiana]
GSSNGNPPERCPHPLYSRDSTQEDQGEDNKDIKDINISIQKEYKEEEYGEMEDPSEGHNDMMKPLNTRNPPERCPRPLYSRDSTQEDHTIPHHHQSGKLRDSKVEVKEEIKEEDDEDGVLEESEISKEHKDLYLNIIEESSSYINPPERCPRPLYSRDSTQEEEYKEEDEEYGVMEEFSEEHKDMMEPPNTRNPPERCPRPLYSRDSTQEGHTIPHHHQGEDLIMKVECEAEETYMRDDQQYTEEAGMTRTFIEEDTSTEISTGHAMEKPSKDHLTLSPGWKMEDEDITQDHIEEDGKSSDLSEHQKLHAGEKRYACPECGKSFPRRYDFVLHQRSHTGEKPYPCPECGKCFAIKSNLAKHQKTHTGEKPYSCPECGKCFSQKVHLNSHRMSHTGEKPYSCPECGKCFTKKSGLVKHQRPPTGEKAYSCTQGRKCLSRKSDLAMHQRSRKGEKPYSCPECGRCFSKKNHLNNHLRIHTGEKPYCCPECGKCFTQKASLLLHQRTHTGEKAYSC